MDHIVSFGIPVAGLIPLNPVAIRRPVWCGRDKKSSERRLPAYGQKNCIPSAGNWQWGLAIHPLLPSDSTTTQTPRYQHKPVNPCLD